MLNKLTLTLATALLANLLCADARGEELTITITHPGNDARVKERETIKGHVSDANAQVWVIIHPLDVSTFYVQPKPTVKKNGDWKIKGYIGDATSGGKDFEIKAVANPTTSLKEGMKLSSWPEAEAESEIIDVIRE